MRKINKKIALMAAIAMVFTTTPVMAQKYQSPTVDSSREVSIIAGKENSKTATIKILVEEGGMLAGEKLEVVVSSGEVTTMNAIYLREMLPRDDAQATNLTVKKLSDGKAFKVQLPDVTRAGDEIELSLTGIYHPLDAEVDEITVDISTPSTMIRKNIPIAEVNQPITIDVDKVTIEAGKEGYIGGKITIAENYVGMVEKGQIKLVLSDDSVKFDGEPEISATNGIVIGKDISFNKDGTVMTIDVVKTAPKKRGEIVIEDLVFSAKDSAKAGGLYLDVYGTALTEDGDEAYWFKNFVTVKAPEVEVKPEIETVKSIVTFMINTPFYMVNDKMEAMDAAPYIADSRTMMPIRYVSKALNINEGNISYVNGAITIFHDNNIIQMSVGQKEVKLNGVPVVMLDTPVSLVNGRAYIPVGQLGKIFNVEIKWDAVYKTVTFATETKIEK